VKKTVAEIAKEYDVTVQALYKRLKRFKTSLTPYLHKTDDGRTLIDPEGVTILTDGLNPVLNRGSKPVDGVVENQFNEFLQNQIRVKDEQIRELLEQNRQLVKEVENFQILMQTEQMKSLPPVIEQQDSPQMTLQERLMKLLRRNKTPK
jgi:hypothetical protein